MSQGADTQTVEPLPAADQPVPEVTVSGQAQGPEVLVMPPPSQAQPAASAGPSPADLEARMKAIPSWKWYIPGFAQGINEAYSIRMAQLGMASERLRLTQAQAEYRFQQDPRVQQAVQGALQGTPGADPGATGKVAQQQPVAPPNVQPPAGWQPGGAAPPLQQPVAQMFGTMGVSGQPQAAAGRPVAQPTAGAPSPAAPAQAQTGPDGQPTQPQLDQSQPGQQPESAQPPAGQPQAGESPQVPAFDQLSPNQQMIQQQRMRAGLYSQLANIAISDGAFATGMHLAEQSGAVAKQAMEMETANANQIKDQADTLTGGLDDLLKTREYGDDGRISRERWQAWGRFAKNWTSMWGQTPAMMGVIPTDANIESVRAQLGGVKAEADYRKSASEAKFRDTNTRLAEKRSRLMETTIQLSQKRLELLGKQVGNYGVSADDRQRVQYLTNARDSIDNMLDIMAKDPKGWYGGRSGQAAYLTEELTSHVPFMASGDTPKIHWHNERDNLQRWLQQAGRTGRTTGPTAKMIDEITKLSGVLEGGKVAETKLRDLKNAINRELENDPAYAERQTKVDPRIQALDDDIRSARQAEAEAAAEQAAAEAAAGGGGAAAAGAPR